jgi:hypothetical protein
MDPRLYDATAIASGFVPGSGLMDFIGQAPAIGGGMGPSFMQNIRNKQYIDAMLQTAGAAGDALMVLPPVGMTVKAATTAGKTARALGDLPVNPVATIRRFDDGGVEVGRQRNDSKVLVTVAPQSKADRMLSASLENIGGYPSGTGDASMGYVDALEAVIKDQRGKPVFWDGFTSDSIQSDKARAIYERLKAAGIPFEKNVFDDRSKNALSLTQEQLFNIDFDSVRRNLTQAADRKKNNSLLQSLGQ